MNEHELVWAFLPDGLEPFFEIESIEKNDETFRIILVEKNILPDKLPPEYKNKKVINSVLNKLIIDDFPIRGRKGELVLKRRSWKFEGVEKMLTRPVNLCAKGTKLGKEFADFLKEVDRA
ncbi:MAG: hypothetical protein KJ687_11415 [Proteobacteria bacterium]|nr:hypothetical protein [Pseudomonadota bacterium]